MQTLLLSDNPGFYFFGTGYKIYWYAVIMMFSILVATAVMLVLCKRRNISIEYYMYFIICVPCGIVGARLFYCITDGLPFSDWFKIHDGGMSIIGALIGGVGAGLVTSIIKKINFFRLADCVLVGIPLAQAIGRWGNFLNQEVYGGVVTDPSLQWFPFAVFIDDCQEWHYAFFFYESVINLIWFGVLFYFAWNFAKKPNGLFTGAMIAFYGLVRTVMEPLRDSQYILGGDNMTSRVFAILMIVLGVGIIVGNLVYNKKTEGAFIGSKNGDPYVCGEFLKFYQKDSEERPVYDKWNIATKLYHREAEGEAYFAEKRAEKERRKQEKAENKNGINKDGGEK